MPISTSDEFPVVKELIYLNHAAVAPWPQRAAEAVKQFSDEVLRHGAAHYPRWLAAEVRLRGQLATLVNAPSGDDIALLKNTSEALSVVAHGFPWQTGDQVVISDEEFPSNRIVWESLKPRGVAVREVCLRGLRDPEQALLEALDRRTRLLSVSSVQYGSGLRLDLARLGEGCRRHGAAFCVDAIQSVGALRTDVQGCQIDFLMADAHKWMLGPEGIAVFYCRPEWRERLALNQFGWHMIEHAGDFGRREWRPAESARRFECGSPNMLGIHALSASLSLIEELGMQDVERRVLENAQSLLSDIGSRANLALITDPAPGRFAGIVTFRPRARPLEEVFERLREKRVVCALRGGGIRFSPHFYTPSAQLAEAVALAAV